MFDRRQFGVAGISALALAALPAAARAQQRIGIEPHWHEQHPEMFHECAKACSDCQRECDSCATHCSRLLAAGAKDHLLSLASCRDCAVICAAAAKIVASGGPFSALICESCARACAECAQTCERFPQDKHMAVCAAACRNCEKACRHMLKGFGR